MKKNKRDARYHQIEEGEWTPIVKRGLRDMCCDCGLVHRIDTREVRGVLEVRKRIERRATAAARRAFDFRDKE